MCCARVGAMDSDHNIAAGHCTFRANFWSSHSKFGPVETKLYGWPNKVVVLTDQICNLVLHSAGTYYWRVDDDKYKHRKVRQSTTKEPQPFRGAEQPADARYRGGYTGGDTLRALQGQNTCSSNLQYQVRARPYSTTCMQLQTHTVCK